MTCIVMMYTIIAWIKQKQQQQEAVQKAVKKNEFEYVPSTLHVDFCVF